MKQTPFYEIGVALKGRPRIFRIVVVAALHFCFLVMLNAIAETWQEEKVPGAVKMEKRPGNDFLSADNAKVPFSKSE